jgi:DNA-binding MarR family transcriptional regulator
MQPSTMTDTHKAFETHALIYSARAKAKSLTGVQEYAIDLYKRGFNPFPIPTAHDWNKRGEEKKPYILEPLFRNRLHYLEGCTCKTCLMYNFVTLFENSNLAIMCGATSGNLLSVDCDSKAAYDFIGGELLRRGLVFPHVWTFKSGRGGGHYLIRLIEGEAADIPQKQSRFEDVQVWASRHFVIVPPSIHPNGALYEWQTPEPLTMLPGDTLKPISVTALDWLGVTLEFSKSENEDDANGLPDYAKNLSHASRHTLKHGAKQGGRNSALWSLACDLVGIGLDEDEVTNALQMAADNCEPPYPGGKKDAPIRVIVKYAFAKERKPSRSYQSRKTGGAAQDWQRAQAFALSYDWHGNFKGAAKGARRVYHACIERARLDSRGKVFRASVREVSKHTGMSKNTAARYLRLLTGRNSDYKGRPLFKNVTAEPLLKWHGSEESGAYKFSFVFGDGTSAKLVQYLITDILLYQNCTTEKCTTANTMPGTDAEINAFHGLGAYAFQVWRALLVQPARSLYEIAKRLKISQHTAKATVTRLVSAGLVVFSQSEGLYLANQLTDAQLAIIAADRGTQNKAQEQRERFTLEREKHANKLVFMAKAYYKKTP